MKILTLFYPVYENRTSDGKYEYGFVTGEKTSSGFFTNSGFVIKIFDKRQKFEAFNPIKTMLDTEITEKSEKALKPLKELRFDGVTVGDFNLEGIE